MKKSLALILMLVLVLCCGCGNKEVITVADDITGQSVEETEYITVDSFEIKKDDSAKEPIGYCAVMIPTDFVEDENTAGMYVSNLYPIDSSNIYYSIIDDEELGFVDGSLDSKSYEQSVENAYLSLGSSVDIVVDSFENTQMEGVPCYKIRSHFSIEDRDVQQLVYIIMSTETHVITYSQASDDELLYDFLESEGEIRLVKEISES